MTLWGKVIDQGKCIGCHACTIACKSEHQVPLGVTRTYVKQVEVGTYPSVQRHFQVTRCNQCEDAPCAAICPVTAMYRRPDGIVDFDRDACIGCKACMAACPYDAIYIDPVSHSAEKCNFCAHRIDQGLEPACVAVCPERAIIVGDLADPESEVSRLVATGKVAVRKPEKETNPKLFYLDASDFTRVPGLAALPPIHATAEQHERYPPEPDLLLELLVREGGFANARRPAREPRSTAAAAVLQYDVPHGAPWDWRVSAYTWTKSVAAGAYLVPALLAWFGAGLGAGVELAATAVALLFLGLTGALLIADLAHPERFWRILVRPRWNSWLARGAYVITAYGALLAMDLLGRLAGWQGLVVGLRVPGAILGTLTAIYTAFLFAQAKARDLWQNPLLPIHLLVQALVAGAAAVLLLAIASGVEAGPALLWGLAGGAAAHVAVVLSELTIPHGTRDAARAAWHLTRGTYARLFWGGLALAAAAAFAAGAGWGASGAMLALAGLLAYEHAYVQAGQSVPLS